MKYVNLSFSKKCYHVNDAKKRLEHNNVGGGFLFLFGMQNFEIICLKFSIMTFVKYRSYTIDIINIGFFQKSEP